MRVKTSITIDEDVLRAVDKATGAVAGRSRVIETAVREFLARRKTPREERDRAILDTNAEALNREMEDVLTYKGDV
jgi:metal-responsive CopG/Arc/MetJ family transcriptional regulator